MIRVLTFTNLYPNPVRQHLGLFVEHRMRRVAALDDVEVKVIAPVPWFPFRAKAFGTWADYANVPTQDRRHGIDILHPRFPVIPKVGMRFGPALMARAMRKPFERIREGGFDFDVIDTHYLYPDGVAAARLGAEFGRPVVMTARGSDVNLIPRISRHAKRAIVQATHDCAAVVCVSSALRDALAELGAPEAKLHVIRNGVDRQLFDLPTEPRPDTRPPTLLSVGNLIENKGHGIAIAALEWLPADTHLRIAGRGPLLASLQRQAVDAGVSDRVEFLGSVDQGELCQLYGTADVLVLASAEEGLPNVVLEAMACGTPVVATRVGGIPESVREPEGGRLVGSRDPEAIATAILDVVGSGCDRVTVRSVTDPFDWAVCVRSVRGLLESVVASAAR